DNNDQLTYVLGPWNYANTGARMSYDQVGNLTSYGINVIAYVSLDVMTDYYSYDTSNKLVSIRSQGAVDTGNTVNFTYDGYGNVTSDGIHTYQYDDASNLTCSDCPGANQITYAYDGNNRRVSRTQNGVTTYYVHAANGDLILEYTPSQTKAIEHIYLHGK